MHHEHVKIAIVSWLEKSPRNVYSQYGEDGIIEALLERVGTGGKCCFEVGAHDGVSNSNVANLIDNGWGAVLIERDPELYAQLTERYSGNSQVACIRDHVLPYTLEEHILAHRKAEEVDLGSIDIDEQDFWLWAGMRRVYPRIMVVEFGYLRPHDQIPVYDEADRDACRWTQAGFNMIRDLGRAKGYVPLAATSSNVIFARGDLLTAAEKVLHLGKVELL